MFEIHVEDLKGFRKCIAAISTLTKEGAFELDEKGLSLKALDPSQIALVLFTMPKESFAKLEVKEKVRIGLDVEKFAQLLTRARAGERLILKKDDARLVAVFEGGGITRQFKLPLIEVPPSIAKELQIPYTATIEIRGRVLKEALQDIALISPHVLLAADDNQFKIKAASDVGEVEIIHKAGEGVNLSTISKTSAIFSQEYLSDIIKECGDDEPVTLYLGAPTAEDKRPKPLCIKYKLGGGQFTFYLAPRIEG